MIPYSLKFSRLKIFAVFAGYDCTTKILSREFFTHECKYIYGRGHLPVRACSTAIDRGRIPRVCYCLQAVGIGASASTQRAPVAVGAGIHTH